MAIILGFIYPLINHDRISGPRPLDLSFGYWQAIQIFWVIFAGLLHLGVIKFGYMSFGKFLWILMIVGLLLPILVTSFLLPKIGLDRYDVLYAITSVNWIFVTAVGLAIYYGLIRMAMKMKNFERI